jgi:ribonuclease-3
MSSANLPGFERLLGYTFQNPALLERAVTHRSWAFERVPFGEENEIRRLQTEYLHLRHPDASEGDLTLMKHHLVSTATLGKIAENLGISKYMRVGRGEEKTGGRRKLALLADTLEAIIAAIFFDSGYIAARAFVNRVFAEEFRRATPKTSIDYKTLLQETLQAEKLAAPVYNVVKTDGPPHERKFFVEAVWETGRVRGKGSSIKAAEMMAANLALQKLNKDGDENVK